MRWLASASTERAAQPGASQQLLPKDRMLHILKFLVMAVASLAEHALMPEQTCVRGASEAAKAARRREKACSLAHCAGAEAQPAAMGFES